MKTLVKSGSTDVKQSLLALRVPGVSESTLSAYTTDMKGYVEFTSRKGVAPGDVSSLKAYKKALLQRGLRPSSVNRKLIAVKRSLLEFARKEYAAEKAEVLRGVYRDVKLVKLNASEKHVSRDKLIEEQEAAALITAMPERVSLIAEFLFQTGARVSEALGVKLSDVKNVNGYSEVIVVGKGSKARTLLVKTDLIQRCMACYAGTEFLFETRNRTPYKRSYILREFLRASKRTLGKRVSPHCARHSFASWTLQRTKKVKGVSEYLGHSDVATTLSLYVHEKLNAEELLGNMSNFSQRPSERAQTEKTNSRDTAVCPDEQ